MGRYNEYAANFCLAAMPKLRLKDYCHGCWNIELEGVGIRMHDDSVTVPMLMCRHRGACEQQRRLIASEEQRRAYEKARFEDDRRKQAGGGEPSQNAGVL